MVGSWCPPISEVHGLASHGQAVPLFIFVGRRFAFSFSITIYEIRRRPKFTR
jgi:hypothetical protein